MALVDSGPQPVHRRHPPMLNLIGGDAVLPSIQPTGRAAMERCFKISTHLQPFFCVFPSRGPQCDVLCHAR